MSRPTNDELNALKEELEGLIKSGNTLVTALQSHDSEFSTSIKNISTHLATASENADKIETLEKTAEGDSSEITDLMTTANSDYQAISELAKESDEISKSLSSQELRLKDLINNAGKLEKTSKSYCQALQALVWRQRSEKEKTRSGFRKYYGGFVFVLAIAALLFVAYFDPISLEKVTFNHESLLPYILSRLPFVIPIVWLAIFAARRNSQALRLEEDYAHKEALSKSFEGYKTQLLEIESGSEEKEATLNLIERTLSALSLHPGRIYQGKHEDISPFHTLADVFKRKKAVG